MIAIFTSSGHFSNSANGVDDVTNIIFYLGE
jgi:hypothetical protein